MKSSFRHMFNFYKYFLNLIIIAGFVFCWLVLSWSSMAGEDSKHHICFFELDNNTTSQNFRRKLSGKTEEGCPPEWRSNKHNTVVHCYQPNGEESKDKKKAGDKAFERMIKKTSQSGKKCDSLVISGHHTGYWYGETGKLWLKTMEALSCHPKYKKWFDNIKALWLDGCNTVTDNFIKPGKTPDSETARVAPQSGENLNRKYLNMYQQAYSGSLNQNTPFSSRYLRMFPNTQIYGFNGAAPSGGDEPDTNQISAQTKKNQVGNESFIFNHLTNLGMALSAEAEYNEIEGDFLRGLTALTSNGCDEEKIEAWEEAVGRPEAEAIENQGYKRAYKLGCDLILAKQVLDNPNSRAAQEALAKRISEDPEYRGKAKILELANQILDSNNSLKAESAAVQLAQMSIVKTLKKINKEDKGISNGNKYSHLLFNNIYDSWNMAKKYKNENLNFYNNVKAELKTPGFTDPLRKRIEAPHTASLRKGDYLKFYQEVHDVKVTNIKASDEKCSIAQNRDEKACFIKTHVTGLVDKANSVFKDLKSQRQNYLDITAKRALAASVVDQLLQYDFLDKDQMKKLEQNTTLFLEDTQNPFVMDTFMRLRFKLQSNQILETVKEAESQSLRRQSAVRVGTIIYLKRFDASASREDQEKLQEIVKLIDNTNRKEGADIYAFVRALHSHLRGKEKREKMEFLLQLSLLEGGRDLEQIIMSYAQGSLKIQEPEEDSFFCREINKDFPKKRRERPIYCKP